MSEENLAAGTNAAAGGQQAEPQGGKVFTQQDVERIIAERLSREREKFADYGELKARAAKWAEFEEQQKSEAQKTQERLARLETERDEAIARSTDRLIRAAFVAEAAKAGVQHPGDAYALADLSGVSVNDHGDVLGVAEAVAAIVAAGRIPLVANRAPTPRLDGGAGGGVRSAETQMPLTDEELAMARRLGLSAERYAARKVEMKRAADNRR